MKSLFKNFNIQEPSTWGGLAILGLMLAGVIPPDVGLGILGQVGGEDVGAGQVVGGLMGVFGTLGSMFKSEGGKKLMLAMVLVPAFMIMAPGQVMAANTVTVSWDIPTERANGDPMASGEVGGYYITVDLPDGSASVFEETLGDATSFEYTPVDPGIYTFRVQAYDKSDPILISGYSNSFQGTMSSDPGDLAPKVLTITIEVTCSNAPGEDCEFSLIQ